MGIPTRPTSLLREELRNYLFLINAKRKNAGLQGAVTFLDITTSPVKNPTFK